MNLELKSNLSVFYNALSPIVFGLLFTLLFFIPILFLFEMLGTSQYPTEFFVSVTFESFMLGFGSFIFIYIMSKKDSYDYFNIIHNEKKSIKNYIEWTVISLVSLLVINLLLSMFFEVLDLEIAENAILGVTDVNPVYLLYLIPVMLFLVGPMEEFIFRGIIQGVFRDAYGVNKSLIMTSVLFGLIHIPAAGGLSYQALLYVLTTFSLGLILGYIYEQQKSLIIPSLAHGMYNSILLIGLYYQVTGVL